MALQSKPHTVTVQLADVGVDAEDTELSPEFVGGIERAVQITPMPSSTAFERFGAEAVRPHLLLDDIDGEPLYRVGNKVLHGSRTFIVAKPPMVWDAEPQTSCVEVYLEETTEGGA